jgi:NAD(P)-dependent dehydrogenase (short-subunit alcohol dehydrogenase family)
MKTPIHHSLFDLSGLKAVVTGASSGLGRNFAKTLAAAGAEVAVAARRADRLGSLVAEIEADGGKAAALSMDVRERASICAALDEAVARFGRIDVIVNNAGVSETKRPLEFTDADWDFVVGTDLTGAWIVAQEAARRMVANKTHGSIINVTSIIASAVSPGLGLYGAAKAGLKHLTRSLALELARYEIRVNSIAPGYVSTELNEEALAGEYGQKMLAKIPTHRFGDPGDLDGALLLLASRAGKHMTGSEIVVDGGHLCSPT